jgi:hypothetical protein
MNLLADPYFWLAAVPATLFIGFGKGGFVGIATLATPLLTLVMPPVTAAAVLLPILIVQDFVAIAAFRKVINWPIVVRMLAGAFIGILLATIWAAQVPAFAVKGAVGLVGLGMALAWWAGYPRAGADRPPPGTLSALFWGALSGFGSFVAHAGGPPFQAHVLPQKLPRDLLVGTTTAYFTIVNLVKVPPYFWLGQFTADNLLLSAALIPFAAGFTLLAIRVVRQVNQLIFYRIMYGLLTLVSLKLIADALMQR